MKKAYTDDADEAGTPFIMSDLLRSSPLKLHLQVKKKTHVVMQNIIKSDFPIKPY